MKGNFFSELNVPIICRHIIGGLTANSSTPLHCHDGFEILIFLGGNTSFFVEQHEKILTPGDIICCPPYTFHRARPYTPDIYERILVNISAAQLNQLNTLHTNLSSCFYENAHALNILHLPSKEWDKLMDYCSQLEHCLTNKPFGYDVLQPALLTQILVLLNQQTSSNKKTTYINNMSPLVSKIFMYIENHFTESITMEQLSVHLHHNADYLTRCFHKSTGCTIQQFIIAKRINFAQKLLREGHNPCDACYSSGFQDYSNFSRTFTKHIGISPKQYQRLHH